MQENRKHDRVSRARGVSLKFSRRFARSLLIALLAMLARCDAGAEASIDTLPVVDFHNDRSFFLTAREIPWQRCRGVQICADRYRERDRAQYFFALFRPPPPYTPGRFGLSARQMRRLAGMSHYEYLTRAITDIENQLQLPVTRDPQELGAPGARIFLGLEGAFLLDDRRPPRAADGRPPPNEEQLRDLLLRLRARGLSYVGLTWSNRNAFAGVAGEAVGLKPAGRRLVLLLRELGLLIDLSHASDQSVRDVRALLGRDYPLFFSHSSARALCDHPRNLGDSLLQLVRETGGLVAVNFHSAYITCSARARRADVVAHVQHIVRVAGILSVALGGDFDGLIQLPAGLGGPPDIYRLAEDLHAGGMSYSDLERLLYRNARRVLARAQALRKTQSQSER